MDIWFLLSIFKVLIIFVFSWRTNWLKNCLFTGTDRTKSEMGVSAQSAMTTHEAKNRTTSFLKIQSYTQKDLAKPLIPLCSKDPNQHVP